MNLMEIGKKPEIQQNEEMEEQIHLPDTIDRWKKLVQEQAKALEIVTVEKDDLQIRCQDMEEFLLKLQEKMYSQRIEKQKLFFENHELQGEIERRNAATHNRIVKNTEAESIASAKQRRSEEQKRIAEQERARAARRRNKKAFGTRTLN